MLRSLEFNIGHPFLSFSDIEFPFLADREVLEISIRALRLKCRKKIKTMCQTIEDVPYLLKSLTEDVAWMLKLTQNLKRIGGMESVKYKHGKYVWLCD